MYLFENPVLQSELLVNLRKKRSFVLLFAFVALLGAMVYAAWPESQKIDMTNPEAARRLVNLFFLGQYLVASLITPSFAAGAITGEKERKSYEMLLASPLRPGAIVLGKLLASLCYVAILVFSSLPIVMLCLPLGGVSFFEVLALYRALLLSVLTSGMISLACSSYFQRTAASLVVSYLLILPLSLVGLWFWSSFEGGGAAFRLFVTATILPAFCAVLCGILFVRVSRRLMYPPDVGSEGKEVVDEAREVREAVGMVIQRDEFPDRLFAPPKRTDLLEDGANPIYDKEMRSELFSQGTLMLRLVIQVSMILALPLMAVCLYFFPPLAPWYISYVILFNMLVGPVFSAGSVTSERETLDLLLVTTLSTVADRLGQAPLRPARVERADFVSALAAAAGLADGLVLLARAADAGRLPADPADHLPDDGPGRFVLLGGVSEDGHEPDGGLSDDYRAVHRAAGDGPVRRHLLARRAGHRDGPPTELSQPILGHIQPAAGIRRTEFGNARGALERVGVVHRFLHRLRHPVGRRHAAIVPQPVARERMKAEE